MNLSGLIALLDHPVTKALIDVGQYAVRNHVMPAVNRRSATPTAEDIQNTANEYATGDEHEGTSGQTGKVDS